MNNEIFFGRKSLRFYYFRYKDSSYFSLTVILVTIVICFLLIFQFIIPQFEQWFSIRQEVAATRERIALIKDNIAYLNTVDRNLLNSQTAVTTDALPATKNIGAVLEALSAASLRSGVSLQDYSFQVGNVSSASGQLANSSIKGISAISMTFILDGTVEQVKVFIQEISKTLPLSEVTAIEGSNGNISLSMDFFQKNLPTQTLQDDKPIPRAMEANVNNIIQLAEWQLPVRLDGGSYASNGAIPLF